MSVLKPGTLNEIYDAISTAERLADWYYNNARGVDQYRAAEGYRRAATQGRRAYSALSEWMSRAKSIVEASDREYDRYVTRDISEGCCSCHISAPCSYCTRETDDEETTPDTERTKVSSDPRNPIEQEINPSHTKDET